MEITQIKWPQVWQQIKVKKWDTCPLHDHSEKKLLKEGEWPLWTIKHEWGSKILSPKAWLHTEVNSKKISEPTKIEHWDTIWIWKDNDVMLAVHKPWDLLDKEELESHVEKAWDSFSKEELKNTVSNIRKRQKTLVWTFIWTIFILVFLLTYMVFYIYSSRSEIVSEINETIYPTQQNINELKWLIWNFNEECFEDDFDCEIESWTIAEKIWKLEWKNKELELSIDDLKLSSSQVEAVKSKFSELELLVSENEESGNTKIVDIKSKVDEISSSIEALEWNTTNNIKALSTEISKIGDITSQIKEIEKALQAEKDFDFWDNEEDVATAIRQLINKIFELQEEINKLKSETTLSQPEAAPEDTTFEEKKSEIFNDDSKTDEEIGKELEKLSDEELLELIEEQSLIETEETSEAEDQISKTENEAVKVATSWDREDFLAKFATCEKASYNSTIKAGNIEIEDHYEILWPKDWKCAIMTSLVKAPEPSVLNKPMYCMLDNSVDFDTSMQSVISSFWTENEQWNCWWEWYAILKNLMKMN